MLLERVPELSLAVSATTRERRPGEENGREYYFISPDEFDCRLAADEFLEWVGGPGRTQTGGNALVGARADHGQGASGPARARDRGSAGRSRPDTWKRDDLHHRANREELEKRLRRRGTESEGEIGERLAQALEQSKLAGEFSYTVVNDDLERAIGELEGIVRREIAAARA